MKVADLIQIKERSVYSGEKVLQSELIALDGKTGRGIFNTAVNKKEYIEQFMSGEVIALWADVKLYKSVFGDYFKPVMKCYVSHNSWKREDKKE